MDSWHPMHEAYMIMIMEYWEVWHTGHWRVRCIGGVASLGAERGQGASLSWQLACREGSVAWGIPVQEGSTVLVGWKLGWRGGQVLHCGGQLGCRVLTAAQGVGQVNWWGRLGECRQLGCS